MALKPITAIIITINLNKNKTFFDKITPCLMVVLYATIKQGNNPYFQRLGLFSYSLYKGSV
ncbi:hypothetical protein PSKAS_18530 [Peribacillus sp. N1]